MNLKDIKIEKIILLITIVFGLILFIDYVFGISNLLQYCNKDIKKHHLNRNIFIHLYSVSLIPVLIFYGLCGFKRLQQTDKNSEPEIFSTILQPFMTFLVGYFLYKLLQIDFFGKINWLTTDLKIIVVMIIQFLFFAKPSFWINKKISDKLFK